MADGPLGSPLPGRMRLRLAPPPSLATNTSAALLVSPDTRLAASEVKATRLPSPLMAGLRLFPVAAGPAGGGLGRVGLFATKAPAEKSGAVVGAPPGGGMVFFPAATKAPWVAAAPGRRAEPS